MDVHLRPGGSDPFFFDSERLLALASEPVVRRGIAYFKENRVLELGWDAARLWAEVEGSNPEAPYIVDVALDEDAEPLVCCTCPFDYEPACKHVVAALVAYAARVEEVAVESASEQAIEERARRGKTEVRVKHRSGLPSFGTWSAHSVTHGGASLRPYVVQIRSRTERMNACECPDFASNRLGTCKHIEAVLHRLRKQREPVHEPELAIVYLALGEAEARDGSGPAIRVRLPPRLSNETAALLARHFDGGGALRGNLPDAWTALEQDVGGHDDVDLGADARAHALRMASDEAHARRRDQIAQTIRRTGGHLPGVSARLYPYQTDGVAFLASTGRAILADDMGLGKTLQAIAAARWLIDHEGVRRVLVVCPASLKTQWAREIARFTGLEALIAEGGASERQAQYRNGATFIIANYELVVRDLGAIAGVCAPDLLILDEAQRIKNWRTKTAAAIKALPTRYAFVLSGTPLENRLEDLYSVMQVVDPRVLGPLWHFFLRFHVSDERGKVVAYRNLSELRTRLLPVLLRREKDVVKAQLPERIVQKVSLPLTDRQRELHGGALTVAGRYARIMKRRPLTPSEEKKLLAALQSARMACDAAGLVDKETVGSPKLEELARILEAACVEGGDKVVVFSQWEVMTRMAEEVARSLGLGVVRLHGGVPARVRGELVDRFTNDPDVRVFIATDAGSTGLNLQVASVLVNLDMPWNPATLEQRIGRIHRLGQRAGVHVFLLVAADSYEERVAALVEGKAELFRSVVAAGDEAGDVVAVAPKLLGELVEAAVALRPPDDPESVQPDAPGDRAETDVSLGELAPIDAPELEAEAAPREGVEPARVAHTSADNEHDRELAGRIERTIAACEAAFRGRIEEIIARPNGLVLIVDRVDEALSAGCELLGRELAVVGVDRRTWTALQRVEPSLPPTQATRAKVERAPSTARRQLEAAEVLIGQAMSATALELVAAAMLARAATLAGRSDPPDAAGAAVWIFSEAIPRGYLPAEIGAAILRAQVLARAQGVVAAVVDEAAHELLGVARAFIGGLDG